MHDVMKKTAESLEQIIERVLTKTRALDFDQWSHKPGPAKWSKTELIGHLIDSANNNLHRFVRATYEEKFKLVYEQDEWVTIQRYGYADTKALLMLWELLNRQIIRMLEEYPKERYQVLVDTGKQQPSFHTIEYLAEDYLDHLQHHLKQLELI